MSEPANVINSFTPTVSVKTAVTPAVSAASVSSSSAPVVTRAVSKVAETASTTSSVGTTETSELDQPEEEDATVDSVSSTGDLVTKKTPAFPPQIDFSKTGWEPTVMDGVVRLDSPFTVQKLVVRKHGGVKYLRFLILGLARLYGVDVGFPEYKRPPPSRVSPEATQAFSAAYYYATKVAKKVAWTVLGPTDAGAWTVPWSKPAEAAKVQLSDLVFNLAAIDATLASNFLGHYFFASDRVKYTAFIPSFAGTVVRPRPSDKRVASRGTAWKPKPSTPEMKAPGGEIVGVKASAIRAGKEPAKAPPPKEFFGKVRPKLPHEKPKPRETVAMAESSSSSSPFDLGDDVESVLKRNQEWLGISIKPTPTELTLTGLIGLFPTAKALKDAKNVGEAMSMVMRILADPRFSLRVNHVAIDPRQPLAYVQEVLAMAVLRKTSVEIIGRGLGGSRVGITRPTTPADHALGSYQTPKDLLEYAPRSAGRFHAEEMVIKMGLKNAPNVYSGSANVDLRRFGASATSAGGPNNIETTVRGTPVHMMAPLVPARIMQPGNPASNEDGTGVPNASGTTFRLAPSPVCRVGDYRNSSPLEMKKTALGTMAAAFLKADAELKGTSTATPGVSGYSLNDVQNVGIMTGQVPMMTLPLFRLWLLFITESFNAQWQELPWQGELQNCLHPGLRMAQAEMQNIPLVLQDAVTLAPYPDDGGAGWNGVIGPGGTTWPLFTTDPANAIRPLTFYTGIADRNNMICVSKAFIDSFPDDATKNCAIALLVYALSGNKCWRKLLTLQNVPVMDPNYSFTNDYVGEESGVATAPGGVYIPYSEAVATDSWGSVTVSLPRNQDVKTTAGQAEINASVGFSVYFGPGGSAVPPGTSFNLLLPTGTPGTIYSVTDYLRSWLTSSILTQTFILDVFRAMSKSGYPMGDMDVARELAFLCSARIWPMGWHDTPPGTVNSEAARYRSFWIDSWSRERVSTSLGYDNRSEQGAPMLPWGLGGEYVGWERAIVAGGVAPDPNDFALVPEVAIETASDYIYPLLLSSTPKGFTEMLKLPSPVMQALNQIAVGTATQYAGWTPNSTYEDAMWGSDVTLAGLKLYATTVACAVQVADMVAGFPAAVHVVRSVVANYNVFSDAKWSAVASSLMRYLPGSTAAKMPGKPPTVGDSAIGFWYAQVWSAVMMLGQHSDSLGLPTILRLCFEGKKGWMAYSEDNDIPRPDLGTAIMGDQALCDWCMKLPLFCCNPWPATTAVGGARFVLPKNWGYKGASASVVGNIVVAPRLPAEHEGNMSDQSFPGVDWIEEWNKKLASYFEGMLITHTTITAGPFPPGYAFDGVLTRTKGTLEWSDIATLTPNLTVLGDFSYFRPIRLLNMNTLVFTNLIVMLGLPNVGATYAAYQGDITPILIEMQGMGDFLRNPIGWALPDDSSPMYKLLQYVDPYKGFGSNLMDFVNSAIGALTSAVSGDWASAANYGSKAIGNVVEGIGGLTETISGGPNATSEAILNTGKKIGAAGQAVADIVHVGQTAKEMINAPNAGAALTIAQKLIPGVSNFAAHTSPAGAPAKATILAPPVPPPMAPAAATTSTPTPAVPVPQAEVASAVISDEQ